MIVLLARLLAIVWAALTLVSMAAGIGFVTGAGRTNPVLELPAFLDRVLPLSRGQRISSLLLIPLLFRAFFTSSVNAALWPWAVLAWVVLTLQLLWLRAHLTGYVEIIERGFDRPVTRYVAGHLAADLIVLIPVVALATVGFR